MKIRFAHLGARREAIRRLLVFSVLGAALMSCGMQNLKAFGEPTKAYPASGLVLHVDGVKHSIDVSCEAIPGYMEAMVMTLPVRKAEALDGLKPGMMVDFKLVVDKEAAYADEIRVRPFENPSQEPMAARQLEILGAAAGGSDNAEHVLRAGQRVPDFTLVDQNGSSLSLSHFTGKVIAMTFIYTRCPLPNFCFRMSNNFGALQKRFANRMGKDLVLLSVTFDPEHDQPTVLAEYARTWTKDQSGWYFLTGAPNDVHKVCQWFGVGAWQDEGMLTHTLHTVVLDRRDTLVANLEGNDYTAQQLGDLVASAMSQEN